MHFACALLVAACSSAHFNDDASGPTGQLTADGGAASSSSSSGSLTPSASGGSSPGDAVDGHDGGSVPPLPIPTVVGTSELCKIINNTNIDDPTTNKTHFTANLKGTDLGIPVDHNGTLYVFFGDSLGYKGIWNGDSEPDAIGFSLGTAKAVAQDPTTLCSQLRFLTLPPANSAGPKQDVRIAADFAAEYIRPPAGHAIGEYIHNPAGKGAFPNLPGDFEVPSGAFSYDGSIWLFYTTVVSPEDVVMKGSYLARWQTPSTTVVPAYDIQYAVDERFDTNGAMHGDFINIAALVNGDYVYLYGTGDYRKSVVHLARKKLTTLSTAGGFERYDAADNMWKPENAIITTPIVNHTGNGEMSVRYYPAIGRFMMINQEETPTSNRVIARFAEAPEGPWSDAVIVNDMGDAQFRSKYCCVDTNTCNGEQLFHCDRAGFYGTYLLPEVSLLPNGKFAATYFMSTWDPYNVALMQTTFE